jgi:hypothetical protein
MPGDAGIMATTVAFIGIFLISLVVALLAAFQIGNQFQTGDELVLVLAAIAIFATAAIVTFAAGFARARNLRSINWIAFVLAAAAFAPVSTPRSVEWIAAHAANPTTMGIENTAIALAILIPTLLAVLVQWGLVRRRWLLDRGRIELTRWPWVTTVIAALVTLNPVGLTIIASTLERSATNFMWQYFALVTASAAVAVFVMALIECYIRGRILRRLLTEYPRAFVGEAASPG